MVKKYTVKNLEYVIVDEGNQEIYWKELGLNIDFLKENKFKNLNSCFEKDIRKLKKSVLLEVSEFLIDDDENKSDDVEKIINSDIPQEKKLMYLLIKEFTLRKKKTIQEYVQYSEPNIGYTSEVVLAWSLYNESPNLLFEIVTYHHWRNRSTDKFYTFGNKQNTEKLLKIAKESGFRDDLCDRLYKKSGQANNYKVYSFTQLSDTLIFQLYKKVNDKTVPDFEEPIRNREVKSVMFSINIKNNHVEIRDYTKKEKFAVIEFLSDIFKCELSELLKEPYVDYKPDHLKETFLGINIEEITTDKLMISAITFNRSTLPKSPSLHFELENNDVMEAVFQAHQSGIINLKDLKDIKSFRLRTSETSRLIRAIPLDSGDVIFSFDDSGLDSKTKDSLKKMFEERFSIPLNQPISNLYFNGDMEEKVDYLMGLTREVFLDTLTAEKLDELLKAKIMKKKREEIAYCPICKEIYEENIECIECEKKLKIRKNNSIEVNKDKAVNYFKRKINGFLDSPWSNAKDSQNTIEKEPYRFLVLTNDDTSEEIRFLITEQQLPLKIINKLNRMVIPTIIVYIGSSEENLERYNDNYIITKNYGFFYTMTESQEFFDYMEKVTEEFRQRHKQSNAKSGLEAFKSLSKMNEDENYTDKDFEYDVFAILNDITHNSIQWGAKYSGKILPEGAFTLSYKIQGDVGKYAYTYDCKLSEKEKGYGLNISEHRKAAQYIKNMSKSDFLRDYLGDSLEITSHLIISNNVNVEKITTMNEHLKTQDIKSRAKLINIEVLLKIYGLYLKNFKNISAKPNYFKKTLIKLINKNSDELLISDVDREFRMLLKDGLMEQPPLDMEAFTQEMLDATDIKKLLVNG